MSVARFVYKSFEAPIGRNTMSPTGNLTENMEPPTRALDALTTMSNFLVGLQAGAPSRTALFVLARGSGGGEAHRVQPGLLFGEDFLWIRKRARLHWARPGELEGRDICAHVASAGEWAHWLAEALPRLDWGGPRHGMERQLPGTTRRDHSPTHRSNKAGSDEAWLTKLPEKSSDQASPAYGLLGANR